MKKKRKIKRWVKFTLIFIFISIIMFCFKNNYKVIENKKQKNITVKNEIKRIYTQEIIEIPKENKLYNEKQNNIINFSYSTRMTSYYSNDGYETGICTGSGLCINDFQVNDKGWYTYNKKLVIATATNYLINYGFNLANNVKTYKYYDEIIINIDSIDYEAIVLDSCGNCMQTGRIDLFVSNSNNIKDTQIIVKE